MAKTRKESRAAERTPPPLPALRLAARGVAAGELSAIDRLSRVPDRLDKYSAVDGAEGTYDEGARERLLTKLDAMAERMLRAREAGIVGPDGGAVPPKAEAGLDAPDGVDFAE
ncbi:MAG: hypothetical protein ACLPGW_05410 [Roseiarcus sp.]